MENLPLISVIVPVYNVEKYLDKCVSSIVDQTYKNLEIILVDDGSLDNCPAMCDAWAEKDNRIKVVHKENGGLSDARNAGMGIVTGEYIAFVDSDDWIDVQMYQHLYDAMTATFSDIASCGARRIWLDGRPSQEVCAVNKNCVFERESAMESLITGQGLIQTVWNKLYNRKVIEGILFPVGLIHEDEFWSWRVIARAKRVVTIEESYYNYLQRDNSIMGTGFSEKNLLVVKAKTELQNYIETNMPKLAAAGRTGLTYICMDLGVRALKTMCLKDAFKYLKYLKSTIKNYPIDREYVSTLAFKQRLHLRMLHSAFMTVCILHSVL